MTFSKTGKSIDYKEKTFQTLGGSGFKAKYLDVETGDHYWIFGCKKNGEGRLYGERPRCNDMMSLSDFYTKVTDLPERFENRELKQYLLALYQLTEANKSKEPTLELFIELLENSFATEPADIDPSWLTITKAPDENRMNHKFTNPVVSKTFDKSLKSETEGFGFLAAVLKFQIAELHKMEDKQLKNEMRYFGIDSETGNRWYNFDPFTNLECGVRCMLDGFDGDETEVDVSWTTLGELLENGRIYE